ncbi:MAG: phosphomannomutase/phosphoglucomutase [Alphaproteobacteria bacterium]|nr:phosphomannomutase/phosphoglucomutase [Alphaproteobacteria bacterium]
MPPSRHVFSPTILREYDIRGQVDINLCTKDAYALGLAYGSFVRRQSPSGGPVTICAGYDGRLSSPALVEALIEGLRASGSNVDVIGLGPTPMLYFSVKDRGADAGIMVTGSHNPADYNGFKMMLQNGSVFGARIQEIGRIAAAGDFESGWGALQEIDVRHEYVQRLLKDYTGTRPLKIAWDSGNGAAGEILRLLTNHLPGEHILLFEEIDGRFPNHHPDPTVDENMEALRQTVLRQGCDLGIGFDGDGDRIGVVDENGEIMRCDILMTIYANEVLKTHPGASIIGDIKCSQVMFDEIARLGGKPVMWKTGHSLIKSKMAELQAPLGGELSGHISFADKYYGFDDALYCAIRLLNDVCRAGGGLSTLVKDLPRLYNTPEIRIEIDEALKFEIVPALIENLKKTLPANMTMNAIDGARVSGPDGWWLLRPSNTQAALVFRVESTTPEGLARLRDMALHEVGKLGYKLNIADS